MQAPKYISPGFTSRAELCEAADALERAEFVDRAPELQPDSAPTYPATIRHPKLARYAAAQRRIPHRRPMLDAKHPRKHIAKARALFEAAVAEYKRREKSRVEDAFQGGLRRLVDAYYRMECARSDLLSLEYQYKRRTHSNQQQKDAARQKEFGALGLAC